MDVNRTKAYDARIRLFNTLRKYVHPGEFFFAHRLGHCLENRINIRGARYLESVVSHAAAKKNYF